MSTTTTTEEDTELRDLVAATLDSAGILGKIKAQLRANVYIALEEGGGATTLPDTAVISEVFICCCVNFDGAVHACLLAGSESDSTQINSSSSLRDFASYESKYFLGLFPSFFMINLSKEHI